MRTRDYASGNNTWQGGRSKKFCRLALLAAVFVRACAPQAHGLSDTSKVTCGAFLASGQANMAAIITWLRRYHAGKRGTIDVIDKPPADPYSGRLGRYCKDHPNESVIDASERILSDLDRGIRFPRTSLPVSMIARLSVVRSGRAATSFAAPNRFRRPTKSHFNSHTADDSPNVTVDRPTVMLKPQAALFLALVIHELAPNAAKCGALSVAGGRVDVAWTIAGDRPTRLEIGSPASQTVAEQRPPGPSSGNRLMLTLKSS